MVADDVVFAYNRLDKSPKKITGYFDHLDKVEATDKHTVVFTFKNYNAEWDYRFGWGYYSGNRAEGSRRRRRRQLEERQRHRAVHARRFRAGQFQHLRQEPELLGHREDQRRRGTSCRCVDKVVYRTIKDEATFLTALRTGKLDILEAIRWSAVDELKKSAPQLQWSKWLSMTGQFLAMRVDTKPFDDIRVRRALNFAVNKQEIVKEYYGGNAELFAYPQHPDYIGYFEPLEAMPDSVKELFTYNPGEGQEAAGRGRLPERLYLQGAGLLLLARTTWICCR